MRTSCINHPAKERLIVIHEWQVELCEGNVTAAALLSFFEYWHNIKLDMETRASRSNDIAELHGDSRNQDETLLQFHTEEELIAGIMISKRDTIRKALSYLSDRGFISIHSNPNPKYAFDKTRYFLFHPEPVNQWLSEKRPSVKVQPAKSKNRQGKTSSENRPRREGNQPRRSESHSAITEITPEITPEITHFPPTPPAGGGVCEKKANSLQQEKEGESEAIAVEVEIVSEEEIENETHSLVESEKQAIQTGNLNPGEDQRGAAARDNSKVLQRILDAVESGRVTKLPPHDLHVLANYRIKDLLLLYRKSGNIHSSDSTDIKRDFLDYVAKNDLGLKIRTSIKAAERIRKIEQYPNEWPILRTLVEGWLNEQKHSTFAERTQTPKEKRERDNELQQRFVKAKTD